MASMKAVQVSAPAGELVAALGTNSITWAIGGIAGSTRQAPPTPGSR